MDMNQIVRNTDGSVDLNASVAAFTKQLRDWMQANEIKPELLDAAIDAVFDENKDSERLPKSALVTLAVTRLNLNASQLSTVTERLSKYITTQPRFLTHKGKNGGVQRLALPGQPIPQIQKEEKKATKKVVNA